MKKIFLFAAAVVAAMTVNAGSFAGFDGRDGTLGKQIYENNLIQDQNNITLKETDATAHKYEIQITTGGECSFTMGGISFWYSNSNDATVAYKSYGTYIQPNGNKRKVTIPTVAGEKVRIYVQDALAGVAVEGASEGANVDFVAWGTEKDAYTVLTATGSEIIIWSDKRDETFTACKFKLGAVLPDSSDSQGIEDIEAAPKAEKFFRNGQLIIRKNGVEYNALGAQL